MGATTHRKSLKALNAEHAFQDALNRLEQAIRKEQRQVADAYRLWELQNEEQQVKQQLELLLAYLEDESEVQKERHEKANCYWLKQHYGTVFPDWDKWLNKELSHETMIKEFILRVIHYQLKEDALKRRTYKAKSKDMVNAAVVLVANKYLKEKRQVNQTVDDETQEKLTFLEAHFATTFFMKDEDWKKAFDILDKTSLPLTTRDHFKKVITEGYDPTLLPEHDGFVSLRETVRESLKSGDYVYAVEKVETYCEPKDERTNFEKLRKKQRHHNVFAAEIGAERDRLRIPQTYLLRSHREEQLQLNSSLSNAYKSIPRNDAMSQRYGLGSWVEKLDQKLKKTLLADVNKSIDQYLRRGWWLSYKRLRYHTRSKGAHYANVLKTQIESDKVKTYADACAVLLRYLRGEDEFHNQGKHSLKQRDYSLSTFLLKNLFSGIYATHLTKRLNKREDEQPMHVYASKVDEPKHRKSLSDDEQTILKTIQKPTYQYFGKGYSQALFKSRESIRDRAAEILERQTVQMRLVPPAA